MKNILIIILLTCSILFANSYKIPEIQYQLQEDNANTLIVTKDYGSITNPGSSLLPFKTINIAVPFDAKNISANISFSNETIKLNYPLEKSSPFSNGDEILYSNKDTKVSNHIKELGLSQVGNLKFYQIGFYPFIEKADNLELAKNVTISLNYDSKFPLKPIPNHNFDFAKRIVINEDEIENYYYSLRPTYDYLIITSEELYPAIEPLIELRQNQNLNIIFMEINDIYEQYQGEDDADKVRNCIIDKYNEYGFTYLLLVGDIDVVPIKFLSPQPNFINEVPSDFYYADLTSNFDFDNDGLYGEYEEDLLDYTSEVYVGRIPLSEYSQVENSINLIVDYEYSNEMWKDKVLLPGGMLNYRYEGGEMEFERTDSADLFEQFKNELIPDKMITTMYEHDGVNPSVYSDYDLTQANFQTLLNNNNYGFINWSVHGSPISSARKIWMEDTNNNEIPDNSEMTWAPLVSVSSINSLSNTTPSLVFCASCLNGKIDYESMSLGETLASTKSAGNISATRTGWYKIGWKYSGIGGLHSYNYYFVDNFFNHKMTFSEALASANFLHAQYFLFGDPIDSNGIVYPELQNIYTYLSYADPAIGYDEEISSDLTGEILIWDMTESPKGLTLINPLREMSGYNVIYIEDLLPNYPDISSAEAVFVLSGFGNDHINFTANEKEVLQNYLYSGGNLYLEGDINWNAQDSFIEMFDAENDHPANIEYILCSENFQPMSWNYEGANNTLSLLSENGIPILKNQSNDNLAIFFDSANYKTIASSFEITEITERNNTQPELLNFIINELFAQVVSNDDNDITDLSFINIPNPFYTAQEKPNDHMTFYFNVPQKNTSGSLIIYNIKGQIVKQIELKNLKKGRSGYVWDGKNDHNSFVPTGIYLCQLNIANHTETVKMTIVK